MSKILHLSDVHFGSPVLPHVVERVLVETEELNPDLIVISGDFTETAAVEEFRAAQQFLEALSHRAIVVTPGNHDVPFLSPLRGIDPFGRYKQFISPTRDAYHKLQGHKLQGHELEGVWVAALNSTSKWGSLLGGHISERQLDQCEQFFKTAPRGTLRVVVAHHHFVAPPDMERGRAMRGARRALDRFTMMDVDLILGGHKHRSYVGNSLDFYSGRDRTQGAIVVHCGTSTSSRGRYREREKNTYNVITHEDDKIRIQHFMHFDTTGGFLPISEHIFVCGVLDLAKPVQEEMQERAEQPT